MGCVLIDSIGSSTGVLQRGGMPQVQRWTPISPAFFFLATNFARRSSILLLVFEGRVIARTSVQGENIRRGRRKEGRKEGREGGRKEGRMEGRKEGKKERREAGDIPVFPIGLLCSLPCFQGVYII